MFASNVGEINPYDTIFARVFGDADKKSFAFVLSKGGFDVGIVIAMPLTYICVFGERAINSSDNDRLFI